MYINGTLVVSSKLFNALQCIYCYSTIRIITIIIIIIIGNSFLMSTWTRVLHDKTFRMSTCPLEFTDTVHRRLLHRNFESVMLEHLFFGGQEVCRSSRLDVSLPLSRRIISIHWHLFLDTNVPSH